jgi:hypothetical protein
MLNAFKLKCLILNDITPIVIILSVIILIVKWGFFSVIILNAVLCIIMLNAVQCVIMLNTFKLNVIMLCH